MTIKRMRSRFKSPCIGPGVGLERACDGNIYVAQEMVYIPRRGSRCAKCHDVATSHVVTIHWTGEITVTKKESTT